MFQAILLCISLFFNVHEVIAKIPASALQHKNTLIRVARSIWGLDAPIALFAAQIHTESSWREDAVSPLGAQGLAQFMPKTANWLPTIAPDTGEPLPFNPAWSLRALIAYDFWLWEKVKGLQPCDQIAFMLAAYNGGLRWVQKDKTLAQKRGLNPDIYWENVEYINAGRQDSAFKENRKYSRTIFHLFQKHYEDAGWGKGVWCVQY